ncbi:15026_t:CDS:2, partial [Entrophospora sp. SA101]
TLGKAILKAGCVSIRNFERGQFSISSHIDRVVKNSVIKNLSSIEINSVTKSPSLWTSITVTKSVDKNLTPPLRENNL